MSHHHTRVRRLPEPTIKDRLWDTQARLHDIARALHRPGPHGATYASDLYDLWAPSKSPPPTSKPSSTPPPGCCPAPATHNLTTLARDDRAWLESASVYAWHLSSALDSAQTAISDIGGHLTTTDSGANDV